MKYEAAGKVCASGPKAGTMALYRHVLNSPQWSATGRGVFECRSIDGSSDLSLHAVGRALDFGYPDGSHEGTALAEFLVELCDVLGIQMVVWSGRAWRIDKGWFTPSKDARDVHRTRIHVELTTHAAETLNASTIAEAFGEPVPTPTALFERGDTGDDVGCIQLALINAGFTVCVDGVFGPLTEEAVVAFQEAHGLNVEGVVGPATIDALRPYAPSTAELASTVKPTADAGSLTADEIAGAVAEAITELLEYKHARTLS